MLIQRLLEEIMSACGIAVLVEGLPAQIATAEQFDLQNYYI